MNKLEQIQSEIKSAMKAQDKFRTGVLRMVLSDIKYAKTADGAAKELSDNDVTKVIASYQKKLSKSLSDFPEGEKKQTILKEIAIVEEFLPKRATDEEIASYVDTLLGKSEERNFGVLMKSVLSHFGASADGKKVSEILKNKLG